VKYYDGTWRPLGTTDANGILRAGVEGAPRNLAFGITHQFVYNEKWQNVATAPLVTFQTKNTVIELRDSAGNLIPDGGGTGAVRYYTGSWHTFASGTTSGGTASMELLPANIAFGLTHQFVYNEKWQNTTTAPTVVFKTGQVNSDTGTCIRYYTGSWHPFTNGMELLPGNILFDFSDATPDTWFTVVGGVVNNIH
jgi:hypothetical protein